MVMLVVRIELDKSKENYQAVMQALAAFDIASAAWEDGQQPQGNMSVSGKTDPNDLGAAVSAAVDRLRRRSGY